MLKINETNKITFVMDIEGTASLPTKVQCVLGADPELVFAATQMFEKNYSCKIFVPATMSPGMVPFKIQAIVNGRLFTPISMMTELSAAAEIPAESAPEISSPAAPAVSNVAAEELVSLLKQFHSTTKSEPAQVQEEVQPEAESVREITIDVADIFSTPISVERKEIPEVKMTPAPAPSALKQAVIKSLFNPKIKGKGK
jgi:hypothetical protein